MRRSAPAWTAPAVLSGLIGAAVGGLIAALLGPIPTPVFSPRASVAVLIASAASAIHTQLGPAELAQTLCWLGACLLLAALPQAGLGLLRMGAFIRLIPHCVTAGFTIGIAIELAWSQWPHLLPMPEGTESAGSAFALLARWAPLAIGLVTIVAIACVHCRPRRPAAAVRDRRVGGARARVAAAIGSLRGARLDPRWRGRRQRCAHARDALNHCTAALRARLWIARPTAAPPPPPPPPLPCASSRLTPAVGEQAVQWLLPHVGPIARILVRQATAQATDRAQLYRLLAAHNERRA